MRKPKDLNGRRFGRLQVVSFAGKNERHDFVYNCKCDCGNEKRAVGYHLLSGVVKSCGCLLREWSATFNLRHGMVHSREYRAWQSAKRRCYSVKSKDFPRYGARGIRMVSRWRNSFSEFFKDMGVCPDGFQLGRIDNDRGYSATNCRWESGSQNCNNKGNNVVLRFGGESRTVTQWAMKLNVPTPTLFSRVYAGWNTKQILFGKSYQ